VTERLVAAGRWLTRLGETLTGQMQERSATAALQWQAAVEATTTGKLAAVAASTVALTGGGAVVAHDAMRPARPATQRPAAVVGTTRVSAHPAPSAWPPRGALSGRLGRGALRPAAGSGDSTASHARAVRREARPVASGSPGAPRVRRRAGRPGSRQRRVRASKSAPQAADRHLRAPCPAPRRGPLGPSGSFHLSHGLPGHASSP